MNRNEARQRVREDFAQAASLFGGDDINPDEMRDMVDNVIDQYEGYYTEEEEEEVEAEQ